MKRIFKYLKCRKGITLVFMAFMLVVLLMLAGLAIDIAYMYYVKNQLQVAADAAALAGAARLDPVVDNSSSAYSQLEIDGEDGARKVAWKFACKNSAAGQSVYLVTKSSTDCDSPPVSGLNETDNNSDGDIVVGHWRSTNDVACQTTWESAGSGFFCRANGNTGLTINALKARPRMTGESGTPMPRVRLFIGQIFSFLGGKGWPYMSASASAIAALKPPYIGPFPICLPSCNLNMPLKTEWGYDGNQPKDNPEVNPILCSDPNLPPGNGNSNTDDAITPSSTPGQHFFLAPSSQLDLVPRPGIAWTNFDINDCNVSPACNMPNKDEVLPYLLGQKDAPEICNENICTSNGEIVPLLHTLDDRFQNNIEQITIGTQTVNGWEVFVPVVSNLSCGATQQTCPGAQGGEANPYFVTHFAKIVITDVITTGAKGFRVVGMENPRQQTFTFKCKEGGNLNTKTITRWITSLNCVDCNNPLPEEGGRVHLVR